MKIIFISTYKPEQCGIATFSENLLSALQLNHNSENTIKVIAVHKNDEPEYPDEVTFQIRQEVCEDYIKAANFINSTGFDLCVIQHEYGIYGGDSGDYLLSLIHQLKIPFIVTAHTILKQPTVQQKSIMQTLAEKGEKIVVMTNKARQFLRDNYEIDANNIAIIEHGVPQKFPVNKEDVLNSHGVSGKILLMTFGLIGRNKGIETVIRSLPKVVEKYPSVIYLVQGNTHPNVLRAEGESYRESLIQLAQDLGVAAHVHFRKGFMSEENLFKLLLSTDIYITPYNNEEQITSGTLSYAIGAGAAVLSTPYWHAQELLADNRGWLFNFKDHGQLSEMLLTLLSEPATAKLLRTNAVSYAYHLQWKNAGKRYSMLMEKILEKNRKAEHVHAATEFIEPGLKHIIKFTDNLGIYQHAVFGLPNYHEGYCLDDNSRALMAMIMAAEQGYESETAGLADVYLSFIQFMQQNEGWFHNFLSFDRRMADDACSEDAYGRTMWALGMLITSGAFISLQQPAEEIFIRALHHAGNLKHIRGMANTIIGLQHFLEKYPFHSEAHRLLDSLSRNMIDQYNSHSNGTWNWFADTLTYDNGILPLALFHAYAVTGDEEAAAIACAATAFLEKTMLKKGHLSLVGSNGWFYKNGKHAPFPQQAIDAMAMVLLFKSAYQHSGNLHYHACMMRCYRWFFAENDLGISLYDFHSQGGCDGLEEYGVNKNQGAESTLALFIAHYTVCSTTVRALSYKDETGSEIILK